jgi:NAD(P)-dependent dehydrogenase (short-subunit alcohol dehydrogenase family)
MSLHSEIIELFDLSGKVALVTGGARDFGFELGSALTAAGADLVITSRTLANAKKSADDLANTYGHDVLPLEMDQSEFSSVSAMAESAHAWKGHIDILVNNAGGNSWDKGERDLIKRDPQAIRTMVDSNLSGVLYCCKEVGKHMAGRGSGKIVNIASMAGLVGRDRRMYQRTGLPEQPVDYAAVKAGVIGMTRDLAGYFAPKGVYVNAISPGGFERGQSQAFIDAYSDSTPLGRMGRDGIDLKGAVLFLSSPASDYVTGHNLVVDGGFAMWK